MILGQISYVDCIVFLICLIPQLLIQTNFFELLLCGLRALPFVFIQCPYQFIRERYFTPESQRSPFVQQASPFQDFVIRCVRYAFAHIPANLGRVFFSRPVALPFLWFRMLRHGFWNPTIPWYEVTRGATKGIWINLQSDQEPDIIIYYCHGGGFSMGSSYFYLEFLLAWVSLLKQAGYRHPALFALEYSLVPDAVYPTQLQQTMAGYEHVCSMIENPSRICVAGDSAGATLILTLLLFLAQSPPPPLPKNQNQNQNQNHHLPVPAPMPGYATLISPWPRLVSPNNRNTPSDYLDAASLQLYGRQYASTTDLDDPLVSPGACKDSAWWAKASPTGGFGIVFGSEEVFAADIRDLVAMLRRSGCKVSVREEPGGIHAGPLVALFLGGTDGRAGRLRGLRGLVGMVGSGIPV